MKLMDGTRPGPVAVFVVTNSSRTLLSKRWSILTEQMKFNKRRTVMKRIVIITAAVLLALSAGTQAFAKSEQMGNA